VFFTPTYDSKPGDRSLMWAGYYASKPGRGEPWYNMNGQDGDSRYGSPAFVDSSFMTLDPHLRSNSWALGAGEGGSDAGAYGVGVVPVDLVPPSAPANFDTLFTSDRNLKLGWTAPGDDGNSGRATQYELRWSNQPITDQNFSQATLVSLSAPAASGSAETSIISNFTPGATYYFAIRASDEVDNWSSLSLLSVTMDPADFDPPDSTQLSSQ